MLPEQKQVDIKNGQVIKTINVRQYISAQEVRDHFNYDCMK